MVSEYIAEAVVKGDVDKLGASDAPDDGFLFAVGQESQGFDSIESGTELFK